MSEKATTVTVLVADDHPIFREGMVQAIKDRPDLELVGEASGGREALERIAQLRPRVALLDIRMPDLNGTEVLQALRRDGIKTEAVFLSAHLGGELAYETVAAGARGYLSKRASRQEICDALVTVAEGGTAFAPEIQSGLATQLRDRGGSADRALLTDRERQILKLVAAGLSAPEIAEDIHLSPTTVKSHLQAAYDKLGVSDRAAAVAQAMRRGLLE